MDNKEEMLAPEIMLKYGEWASEIESLAGPISRCVEKLIEINKTQRLAASVEGSSDIAEILLVIRRSTTEIISLAPKTAAPQPQISFRELYTLWLHDIRSSLIGVYSSMHLMKDIVYWKSITDNRLDGNDAEKRTFEKLVLYAEILELMDRDPELYHNQLPRRHYGPDISATLKSLHESWRVQMRSGYDEMPENVVSDFDWIHRHEKELLENNDGGSIIVYKEKVVGVGNTYSAALEDAKHNLPPNGDEITPVYYELHDTPPFIRIRPKSQ